MTIGIVCCGPNAGLACFRALVAVEAVATGAIGGFVAFAAIEGASRLHRAETQRGGSRTLFLSGEQTGVPPPERVAGSPLAGLISSGPDRPGPLSQFLAADPGVGIVSGHRLPNGPGADGTAHNLSALNAMRGGATPQAAITTHLDAHTEADVGLIAADLSGRLHAANTARVARRPDLGAARCHDAQAGAAVAVLHNALGPGPSLAFLAAETAMAVMVPAAPDASFCAAAGTPLALGPAPAVEIDAAGTARRIITTDASLLAPRANGAAIYLGASVRRDGQVLGHVTEEPNCQLADGHIAALSGQEELAIGYRTSCRGKP